MKNLANCKPSEFLAQTNKIRKSVEKWLRVTDITNIRKRLPAYETVPMGASEAERREVNRRNEEREEKQLRENFSAILDAMLEEHPAETLEILALCCFVEPENVDDYPMHDYIEAITEILADQAVTSFFTSLIQLGRKHI